MVKNALEDPHYILLFSKYFEEFIVKNLFCSRSIHEPGIPRSNVILILPHHDQLSRRNARGFKNVLYVKCEIPRGISNPRGMVRLNSTILGIPDSLYLNLHDARVTYISLS